MDVEVVITFVDTLIFHQTGKHLDTLQTNIFRGSWLGKKYEYIAEQNYCSDSHIKMLGANLWESLSTALNEKVTKKNFRAVLERRSWEFIDQQLGNSKKVSFVSKPLVSSTTQLSVATKIELELPEGRVPLGSPFYISHSSIESQCDRTILKPGALIRIKAPRQMGKSSLMARVIDRANQGGYHTVTIDFQLADRKIFQDFDLFLKWFCISITRSLALPNRLNDYWDDIFGSKMSCKDYFEKYLLTKLEQPLVLALEEVDLLFQYADLADDFFALLRSWHEEAKSNSIWQKLRLVLAHSTEVYIPLNINQSPFNVGLPLELPEFSTEQILDLAARHGLNWDFSQVEKLVRMVGGHPFLVRIALYNLTQQGKTLEQLFAAAITETSPFNNNLRRHLWQLKQQPELASSLQKVLNTDSSVRLEPIIMFKLHSMGLVHLRGNEITPRCELYRLYFKDRLQDYAE